MRRLSIIVACVGLSSPLMAQTCMSIGPMVMCSNGFSSIDGGQTQAPFMPAIPMPMFQSFIPFGPQGPGTATQWATSQQINPDGSRTLHSEFRTLMPDGTIHREVQTRVVFPDGRICDLQGNQPTCK